MTYGRSAAQPSIEAFVLVLQCEGLLGQALGAWGRNEADRAGTQKRGRFQPAIHTSTVRTLRMWMRLVAPVRADAPTGPGPEDAAMRVPELIL